MNLKVDRDKYIGASDAYKIMKGEWLALYEEKKGLREPDDLSGVFRVQLGIHTEPFHLAWLSEQLDYDLRTTQREFIDTTHGFPLRVHPDAMCAKDLDADNAIPVEVKHTNHFATLDKMMESYGAQLHLQMLGTGTKHCLFSFIAGNSDPEANIIRYDEEFGEQVIKMCQAFWWHIENDEPPSEVNAIETPTLKPSDYKPYDFEGKNEWASAAVDYIENKAGAAKFETAKTNLKKLVPDDASEVTGHGIVIKRSKSGSLLFK